ncbi:MAG: hypothetical protein J0651_02530, partial [Actinobacteria bacterium]|nr:hypothetical protein [Actinomycetota bacterium]
HVPGPYRSSADENRKNAAMSMMFKMGEMATLPNMVSALPITSVSITLAVNDSSCILFIFLLPN